jgi:RNA polymerase sigma factor (TIGR02999 family)
VFQTPDSDSVEIVYLQIIWGRSRINPLMFKADPTFTDLLIDYSKGNESHFPKLVTLLYEDLRVMASRLLSRESIGHTLHATDLVNESFLKLVDQTRIDWQGRTHFMAVSAQVMRRILIDHERTKHREKRGGRGRVRVELRDDFIVQLDRPDEILAVDEILKKLSGLDPTHARILELRYFGGLGMKEIAAAIGVSARTVERHWTMIRAWVLKELEGKGTAND